MKVRLPHLLFRLTRQNDITSSPYQEISDLDDVLGVTLGVSEEHVYD